MRFSFPISFLRLNRRRRIVLAGMVLLLLLLAFAVPKMLECMLFYETPLEAVDVVLVGNPGNALDTAIRLYRKSMARSILITRVDPLPYRDDPQFLSVRRVMEQRLAEAGVPDEAIFHLEMEAHNMLERQLVFRDWVRRHEVHSYIVFPGHYGARLIKMLHEDTFPEGDVRLVCRPSSGAAVFRKELLGIQNTLIRMAYWVLVYRPRLEAYLPTACAGMDSLSSKRDSDTMAQWRLVVHDI